ncbi:MAG: hypothetical protein KKE05_06780 [Nanoarchaeota archaeon]|nr:hypothetical protein [Nanoarchaeota archaeon]
MEIITESKNSLLNRTEVKVKLSSESNPGLEKSKQTLADKFKTKVENVVINKIASKFGTNEFILEASVYNTLEDKERIEPKKKEKKKAA